MFPEGLTTTSGGSESLDFSDSGESVATVLPMRENSWRGSMGVGGVIVVTGAGMDVFGGVAGVGLGGLRCFSSVRSVRIGGGNGGGRSHATCAFPPGKLALLLLLLLPRVLAPFLLPFDLSDPRSQPLLLLLESFLSWLELRASFSRRPGEPLLFFPMRLSGISKVEVGCVTGLDNSGYVLSSEASAL